MARPDLRKRLEEEVFLLDGAMGTQLIARGARPGACHGLLNLEAADIVLDIHRAYFEAGSDAVLTNTFGANRYALARYGCAGKEYEINKAGAEVARRAAGEDRYVLGDLGPTGGFLEPLGPLRAGEVKEAYVGQVEGLLAGGVDGFIIETMTALDELGIALGAARLAGGGRPVLASMSLDKGSAGFRTMMGVDVPTAVSRMVSLGADAVGFNCGAASLDEYVELSNAYVAAAQSSRKEVLVFAEPNAGKPELVEGPAVYKVTPEEFAAACRRILKAGIHILGGCCGTTPAHIHALAQTLKD